MALSVPASRVHPGSPSLFSSPSPLQERWPPKCGPTSGPLHLFLPRPGMLFPKNPRRLLPRLPSPVSLFQCLCIRHLSDHAMLITTHISLLCPAPLSYCLRFFTAQITTRPPACVCLLHAHRLAALGERRLFCSLFFPST